MPYSKREPASGGNPPNSLTETSFIKFFYNHEKEVLIVQNAVRVVKILNADKKVVMIQTAAPKPAPTVFNTDTLKKGIYTVNVADLSFIFIKK